MDGHHDTSGWLLIVAGDGKRSYEKRIVSTTKKTKQFKAFLIPSSQGLPCVLEEISAEREDCFRENVIRAWRDLCRGEQSPFVPLLNYLSRSGVYKQKLLMWPDN